MIRTLMLITALAVLLPFTAAFAQKAPALAGTWFAMLEQETVDGLPDEKLLLSANGTGALDTHNPFKWKAENGRLTLSMLEDGEVIYEYVYKYAMSGATLFLTKEENGRSRQYSKTAKQKAAFLNKITYPAVSVNTGSENSAKTAAAGDKPVVYILGNDAKGACYWKDGVKVDLLPLAGEEASQANAIAAAAGSVYVAGYYAALIDGSHITKACYWKDGVRVDLHYDDLLREMILTGGPISSEAKAIAVTGNTVHIAGHYGTEAATYWKADAENITRTILIKPPVGNARHNYIFGAPSEGNGIAVLGNTVYISGYYTSDPLMQHVACYWKDGKRANLFAKKVLNSFEMRHNYAHKMAISGNSPCILGHYEYYNYACACEEKQSYYWKDEAITLIDDGYAEGIAVSGNTVYAAGFYYRAVSKGAVSAACYWEGAARKDLDVPKPQKNTDGSWAGPITTADNVVYIAGHYNQDNKSIPCYWINGKRTDLPAAGTGGSVTDITVVGGKK